MNLSFEFKNNLFEFYISASTQLKPDSTTRASFGCPAPDGSFIHEVYTMFWRCSNNIAFEFNCPPGLAFNDYSKICD